MRIALVCRRYYPEIGGVETHVREIAERFAKNKNEVTVFTLANDNKQVGTEVINNVTVKRFKCIKLSYSMEFPPQALVKSIEEFRPDIVHAHSVHTTIPHFASQTNGGSKFVVTPHYLGGALTPFRRVLFAGYKPYLNRALAAAESIVCTSSIEQEMLLRDFKSANARKIKLIPNGVDAELLKMTPVREGLRILSVARLDLQHKRTDKLVRAFKILESKLENSNIGGKDAKLVLVGNGPDKDKIVKLINDLQLQQKVEVKSNLSKEELYREYASASVFILASEMENFNIAVAEALSAKLKVVIPNTTALAHYVKDGHALGLEPPITPEGIADGILRCLQENDGNTIKREYSPYTWDMVALELQNMYNELLTEKKPLNRVREYNRRMSI